MKTCYSGCETLENSENCQNWVSCKSFSNAPGRLMSPAHPSPCTCQTTTSLLCTNIENCYLAAIFSVVTINTIFISIALWYLLRLVFGTCRLHLYHTLYISQSVWNFSMLSVVVVMTVKSCWLAEEYYNSWIIPYKTLSYGLMVWINIWQLSM